MNKQQVVSENFDLSWIHKDAKCWVYFPNKQQGDIYLRGTVIKINPLSFNKQNSLVRGVLQNGIQFQSKAYLLQKCRDSRSIQKDLIEMDIINGAQVLNQLKRRFQEKKIHTFLWNSLIIVNPFELIAKNYSPHALHYYYEHVFLRQHSNLSHVQPHIYAFVFNILKHIKQTDLIQVLSISGQSGSGKTQTNKQCLRAISYGCEKQKLKSLKHIDDHNLELRILQCDPILQAFGNAKTVKNDNSSRFGKLITIKIDPETMSIHHSSIRNYFLQKSRIISQSFGERNFHIFYIFLKFINDHERSTYKLKSRGIPMKLQDFRYLSQKSTMTSHSNHALATQKQMWTDLLNAFKNLEFRKEQIHQIWSIISAVLLLGNVYFDGVLQNDNDPCEIASQQLITNISHLLKINRNELQSGLIFNKKVIAGQLMLLPLTQKQCEQGRDSMAKAIYEGLFLWIVEELNNKVNQGQNLSHFNEWKEIKLLDIYGFQVFQKNSFQQLCVNYTNEKIHQIYLQQVFIQQKKLLIAEGLAASIPHLNFTDNFKIIELIDISPKSIYNLLDESCTLNVKDIDFLANVRKAHQGHENFPLNNSANIRNSFIIRHTPGEIEYMVQGFRDKNKDLLRQDIVHKLSQSQSHILRRIFEQKIQVMKQESNKKFLGIKVRKEVKQLITQMSTSSNLHFVRCIKPNEEKRAFHFVDRVCYNQIKYLGILDTIQMRKDSYHVRIPYKDFYSKFGLLDEEFGLSNLIALQNGKISTLQCRQLVMRLMTNNSFTNHKLQYLFGKQKIFMKMSTKNFFDIRLRQKTDKINYVSTIIKASYRKLKISKVRKLYRDKIPRIQHAIRNFLTIAKLSRKKKAVYVIETYWIKYCHQFFMRKRRNHLIALQKYIKRAIEVKRQNDKAQSIMRLKSFIQSALKTHKSVKYFQKFIEVKKIVEKDIYDKIWTNMAEHYKYKLSVYLRTFTIRKLNKSILYESQKTAAYRQSVKTVKQIEKYFKGFLIRKKVAQKLKNVLKIQNYIRMSRFRKNYSSLKDTVIKIQRAWRNYYDFKAKSILMTKRYFEQKMRQERLKIDEMLFRTIDVQNNRSYNQLPQHCMEKILYNHDRIKYPKISLFYYLLDFQLLCPVDYIYPQKSWVQNYCTLFKESLQKGNPIQYLDISSTHTVCTTINKIYQWGEIHEDSNIRTQKQYQNIPTPNCRISKIKACDGFTIIQTEEPQELLVMGDQQEYQQSSIKEWSTLKQKYVLLNGVILTLINNSLTRMPISEKVTQLSCGMAHTICRTSLKKVYSWGQNTSGQLGHGNFHRLKNPKTIQFFNKYKIVVSQVGVTAYGSVVLDMNGKVWWFGTNGTILNEATPKQAFLPLKSEFIDNTKKYSFVRIIPKWSKSISLIGVTIAMYESVFNITQTSVRKKCLQNLMQKWSEDIETINPPYVQAISGYFFQKHMYFKKSTTVKKSDAENHLTYQQIKNKLVNEMMMIEHAQRKLLSTIKGQYRDNKESINQDMQVIKNL